MSLSSRFKDMMLQEMLDGNKEDPGTLLVPLFINMLAHDISNTAKGDLDNLSDTFMAKVDMSVIEAVNQSEQAMKFADNLDSEFVGECMEGCKTVKDAEKLINHIMKGEFDKPDLTKE